MGNKIMHEQLTIYSGAPIIARKYDYEKFTFPWHVHNEYEIIYVEESCGERFVADSMETFQPNDLTLIGSGIPHYMKSILYDNEKNKKTRVKGIIIQFEKTFMAHAINNYTDLSHIKNLLEESRRGIHFPYPQNQEIIRCITQLPESNGTMRIINLLHLLDLMAKFPSKRSLGSPLFCQSLSLTMEARMKKILSYLMNHYKEDIDLNEISSLVAMNSSSFCRYFKEKSGKTFTEYVLDLRIGYACKLLVENEMDISQICIESGFNTITHFNRIFKRNTGTTPTEYRKQFIL